MKLSTKSRYGLKAAYVLAARYNEGPIPLREIAKTERLTEKYLEQLLALLRKAGVIEAVRGAAGGYQLTRPPKETSVLSVITALEPITPVDCLENETFCSEQQRCATRKIWKRMEEGIQQALAGLSLQDMLEEKQPAVNTRRIAPVKK